MTDLFSKYSSNLLGGDKYGFDSSKLIDNIQKENKSTAAKPDKTGNFLSNFISKNLKIPGFGKDKEGKTFNERFGQAFESYKPKDKESGELIADALADQLGVTQGFGGRGFTSGLPDSFGNPSFMLTQNSVGAPTVIQGTKGEEGYGPDIGAAVGTAVGGPIGGAIGRFAGSLLCDIRCKEDIAPLCESEVNDLLSECAFFVKELNECS